MIKPPPPKKPKPPGEQTPPKKVVKRPRPKLAVRKKPSKSPAQPRDEATRLLDRLRTRYAKPVVDKLIFGHFPFPTSFAEIPEAHVIEARRQLFVALRRAREDGLIDAATDDLALCAVAEGLRVDGDGLKDDLAELKACLRKPLAKKQ